MAAIGHLLFCKDCGDLLPPSKGDIRNKLNCTCCGAENNDAAPQTIVTRSKPSDFPSALRQKLSAIQTVERHKLQTERIDTNMDCDKCGRKGIRFSEAQLRSADEGSTIFYNCECGHRWTINN